MTREHIHLFNLLSEHIFELLLLVYYASTRQLIVHERGLFFFALNAFTSAPNLSSTNQIFCIKSLFSQCVCNPLFYNNEHKPSGRLFSKPLTVPGLQSRKEYYFTHALSHMFLVHYLFLFSSQLFTHSAFCITWNCTCTVYSPEVTWQTASLPGQRKKGEHPIPFLTD